MPPKRKRGAIHEKGSDDEQAAAAPATTQTTDKSFFLLPGAARPRVQVTHTPNEPTPSQPSDVRDNDDEPFYPTTWALHAQGSSSAHPEVVNGADTYPEPAPAAASSPPRAKKKPKKKSSKNVCIQMLMNTGVRLILH